MTVSKCMSYKEFLNHLATTAIRPWNLTGTLLRCYDNGSHAAQCPITAVAYKLTGAWYNLAETMAAAERIGIGHTMASLIVTAADNMSAPANEELAVLKLRREMRAALGSALPTED